METLTVTLETAKKLKAAGFEQKPTKVYWHWAVEEGVSGARIGDPIDTSAYGLSEWIGGNVEWFAAPTAQEIADQLPEDSYELLFIWQINLKQWHYMVRQTLYLENDEHWEEADTMAEALAALWLKLNDKEQN